MELKVKQKSGYSTFIPLKKSENWRFRFSDVFRGYRSGTLVKNGLIKIFKY